MRLKKWEVFFLQNDTIFPVLGRKERGHKPSPHIGTGLTLREGTGSTLREGKVKISHFFVRSVVLKNAKILGLFLHFNL